MEEQLSICGVDKDKERQWLVELLQTQETCITHAHLRVRWIPSRLILFAIRRIHKLGDSIIKERTVIRSIVVYPASQIELYVLKLASCIVQMDIWGDCWGI